MIELYPVPLINPILIFLLYVLCLCNYSAVCMSSLLKQRVQSEYFIVKLLHTGQSFGLW